MITGDTKIGEKLANAINALKPSAKEVLTDTIKQETAVMNTLCREMIKLHPASQRRVLSYLVELTHEQIKAEMNLSSWFLDKVQAQIENKTGEPLETSVVLESVPIDET